MEHDTTMEPTPFAVVIFTLSVHWVKTTEFLVKVIMAVEYDNQILETDLMEFITLALTLRRKVIGRNQKFRNMVLGLLLVF